MFIFANRVRRFNHLYRFLGVPFQDVAVLPPSKL